MINRMWNKFLLWCEKLILGITPVVLLMAIPANAATVTDYFDFRMSLRVPRIYDNTTSLGSRKYQTQNIKGTMMITYDTLEESRPVITITNLVNHTHKINGVKITYDCLVDSDMVFPRVNLIGSNKTGIFKKPSVVFYLDAEPSYNIGEDDEDNSLLITLGGEGTVASKKYADVIKTLRGYAAGTLGCGCKAYGHVSPTRVAGACGATCEVDDVAAVHGKWYAKWRCRYAE